MQQLLYQVAGTEREIMTEEKGKGVAGGDVPGADQEKGGISSRGSALKENFQGEKRSR